MMFKRKGGVVKGLLNNVKKTALFLQHGFPKYIFVCLTLSYFLSAVAKLYFLKVASEQNSVMGAPTTGGDGGVKIPSWLPSLYGG